MYTNRIFAMGLTGLMCVSFTAAAAEVSEEGLQLVEKAYSGSLYADPDVDWSGYNEIQLLDVSVAFRKNWQRDQNRGDPFKVRDEDVEDIKKSMAELFNEVFTEELSNKGGYVISAASGKNVLTIQPAIVELDVAAPDTQRAGIYRQYTESAGEMTLELKLLDSVSGELLAKSSDHREAPRYGYLQWTSRVTNEAEARRMMRLWARNLLARLEQARSAAATDSAAAD